MNQPVIKNEAKDQRKPIELARTALKRLSELNAAPTPENYVREYRRAAGLPLEDVDADTTWTGGPEAVQMVVAIVQAVAEASGRLTVGLDRLNADSNEALAVIPQISSPDDLARLLRTVTGSAVSMKSVIDTTSRELAETRAQLAQVSSELARSQTLARTDPLTGLGNRRALMELLSREIARSSRSGEALSIAVIDIDHFKQINDQHGHGVGDMALAHLATMGKSCIREIDEIYRLGGEEFVVALPGSSARGAEFVVDRMRMQLERAPVTLGQCKVTLRYSAGVAQFMRGDSVDSLLARADKALYEAKSAGRNRVVVAAGEAAAA